MNEIGGPRCSQGVADEEGFTLIECVVALMIATLMFLALAMSLGTSLRATVSARSNQQAIDLANDQLEQLRALDFAGVAMSTTDSTMAADTCANGSSVWCVTNGVTPNLQYPNPAGGPPLSEAVYRTSGGGVGEHVRPCRAGSRFTCKVYVTSPVDTSAVTYRRASVVVQWKDQAGTHTRFSSSFITASRRGLASPAYTWAATPNSPTNVPIIKGGRGAFFATLTNQGVPLRWNLAATMTNGSLTRSWTVQWYRDTDCNGSWDSVAETATLDGDGNGVGDTGIVPTEGRICVVGVVYVPSDESLTSASVALAATPSTAATGYTSAVPVTATATINGTGALYRTFNLHNWATGVDGRATGDTTSPRNASDVYKLTTEPPRATQLFNFDTDRNSAPGLTIAPGTSAGWQTTVGASATSTLGSSAATNATVDFYAVSDDLNAFTSTKVTVQLKTETSADVFTAYGPPVDVTVSGATGFAHLSAAIPLTARTLDINLKIRLELSVPTGSTPVRMAYDATGAPATLVLPYSTGNPS